MFGHSSVIEAKDSDVQLITESPAGDLVMSGHSTPQIFLFGLLCSYGRLQVAYSQEVDRIMDCSVL